MPALPCVEITFPRYGISVLVELFASDAPATCQTLLDRLPIEADSYHTKWNGNEIFAALSPFEGQSLENLTTSVSTGDVVLFRHPPSSRGTPVSVQAMGLRGYAELGLFYGPMVRAYGPAGSTPGARVGRVITGLDPLAVAVQEMRRSGFATVVLRQRESPKC